MSIIYDAVVASGASQWYGEIIVSNIRNDDETSVNINTYLAMNFHVPGAVSADDITPQFSTWVTGPVTASSTALGDNTYTVDANILFTEAYTLRPSDQITIGVNGDLTQDTAEWLDSFVFGADAPPAVNGTVVVTCAACPDPALEGITVQLTFSQGSSSSTYSIAYNNSVSLSMAQGTYQITASDLSTDDQTVIAPVVVAPPEVDVAIGQTSDVSVVFDTVQYYSALDVSIGDLQGLANETLAVTVTDQGSGTVLASFSAGPGSVTSLRKLPASGTAVITVQPMTVNNVSYTFDVPPVTLANSLQTVTISDANVTTAPVDTTGFVNVPIDMQVSSAVSDSLVIRIVSSSMSYSQSFRTVTQSTAFSVPVKPDSYTVDAADFIDAGIVYDVEVPAQFIVSADGSATLNVSISASANLNVKGFPSFLSFGGCTDLVKSNATDFTTARASSIFVYAGVDGAGDPGTYETADVQTQSLMDLARQVEQDLLAAGTPQNVLPVPICYTCNLSGGNPEVVLADSEAHAHSFANYILTLNTAGAYLDEEHPVPAGVIVNPDFLGTCQQANLGPDYAMPVRVPLQEALTHWNMTVTIPPEIEDNIAGYVMAVNWLTHIVAPWATFGWQINLWDTGDSEWIYDSSVDPADKAKSTADYIVSVGAYNPPYAPNFLAIDRYEADDYEQRGYMNHYCYGPLEWSRYFDFCAAMSRALKLPVMPWQIPSSRTPNTTDVIPVDFEGQHWGTGGSYILGDSAIGSDYHNVNANILALQFPAEAQAYMGETAQDMYIRSEPFDMTNPAYGDFPLRGIFAVLLGGGSTTGIVSTIGNPEPWVRNKLNAYMANPIPFDSSAPAKKG